MAVNNNNFFDGPFFDGPFFDVGTLISGGGSSPSQGLPAFAHARPQTKEQKRKSREDFGIIAKEIIAAVAQRQAERLEQDTQKQFEELERELQLKDIEFEGRYLEALNVERERLINAEISNRLKKKLEDEQTMLLMLMAAV